MTTDQPEIPVTVRISPLGNASNTDNVYFRCGVKISPMGSVGRHSGAPQSAAGTLSISEWLTLIAVAAVAGLSVYAFLFMFNAFERLAISGCACITILGGFAAVAPRGGKTVRAISALTPLLAVVTVPLRHWLGWRSTSMPAPVIFAIVVCAVIYACLIGGLVIGAMVFDESRGRQAE